MEELITVADTFSIPEAHMMKARLEAEGITCFLRGDLAASCVGVPSQLNLRWSDPNATIEVRVPASEIVQAKTILQQVAHNEEPRLSPGKPRRFAQIAAGFYLACCIGLFMTAALHWVAGVVTTLIVIGFLIFVSYKSQRSS